MMSWTKNCLLALAPLFAVGCADNTELDIPSPPTFASRADEFDSPTGSFSGSSVEELLLESIGALYVGQAVAGMVGALPIGSEDEENESALVQVRPSTQDKASLTGQGYIEVKRQCDEGVLDMFARFTESSIERIMWGTGSACRLDVEDAGTIQLDGPLFVEFAEDFSAETDVDALTFDVVIAGSSELLGLVVEDYAIRVRSDGPPLALLPVSDGYVVAEFDSADEPTQVTITATDGTFVCDVSTQTCLPEAE